MDNFIPTSEKFKVVAPTRADLAGGTLDIWPLYCGLYGGRTINVGLDLHASATFEVLPAVVFKFQIESFGGETCTFEEPLTAEEAKKLKPAVQFPAMVVSQFLRQQPFLPEKFVKMKLEATAPLRSGLGGSSTLCVAMVRGLGNIFAQFQEQGWQWRMLEWVKDVEAAFLNTPTGTQDYLAALFGGLRSYKFDIGGIETSAYSDEALRELNERMVVLFSGEMHSSGLSNWELYKGWMEDNKKIQSGFGAIRDVAESLHGELSKKKLDWKAIGHCLNEEWKVRKSTFKVETKRLDEIVDFLSKHKVLGRKVCGAAQGGSLIALVDPAKRGDLIKACEEEGIQVLKTSVVAQGVHLIDAAKALWQKSENAKGASL